LVPDARNDLHYSLSSKKKDAESLNGGKKGGRGGETAGSVAPNRFLSERRRGLDSQKGTEEKDLVLPWSSLMHRERRGRKHEILKKRGKRKEASRPNARSMRQGKGEKRGHASF